MNMTIKRLLEQYEELFHSGYPSMQLGIDENMIAECIHKGIMAEKLYADKLKEDVEY